MNFKINILYIKINCQMHLFITNLMLENKKKQYNFLSWIWKKFCKMQKIR